MTDLVCPADFEPINITGVSPRPALALIVACVCEEFSVSETEMRGDGRPKKILFPRAAYYWLARECTFKSTPVIGRHIRRMDHSTVAHGICRAEQLRRENPSFREITDRLRRQFKEGWE
jgi:chromosomal replication initiation ATPase DnaA